MTLPPRLGLAEQQQATEMLRARLLYPEKT